MTPFERGAVVRLTERMIEARVRPYASKTAIWKRRPSSKNVGLCRERLTRTGVVVQRNSYSAYVRWDGLKSIEQVPLQALERVA